MKSFKGLSLAVTGLASVLLFVQGPAARAAAHQVVPLDDPPIAWSAPAHVSGRRMHRLVSSSLRVRHHVAAPEGDPPIAGGPHVALAAVTALAPSLRDTGRIASTDLHASGETLRAVTFGAEVRRERAVRPLSVESAQSTEINASAPILQLRGDLGASSVKQCRIEVARRRQVRLDQVDVGTLRVRWTVRTGGDVRDAEIVGADGTDASVAACVKRVVSMGTFIPQPAEVAVERTYAL